MASESNGVIDIVQQAGQIPEYRRMADYVRRTAKVQPTNRVAKFDRIGTVGMFDPGANEIVYDPSADVGTVIHETAHAVDFYMAQQYLQGKMSPDTKATYEKLKYDPSGPDGKRFRSDQVLQAISKPTYNYEQRYRVDPGEALAFSVQKALTPQSKAIWPIANHIDHTLATEFMILLDKATKDLPVSEPQPQQK